ncbi:hypothetical protein Esti_003109 [Eimeria stiedai]
MATAAAAAASAAVAAVATSTCHSAARGAACYLRACAAVAAAGGARALQKQQQQQQPWRAAHRRMSSTRGHAHTDTAAAAAEAAAAGAGLPSACLSSADSLAASLPLLPPQLLAAAARRLLLEGVEEGDAWRRLGSRAAETASELTAKQCAAILKCFAARRYRDFCCFSALTARLTEMVSQEGPAGLSGKETVSVLTACATLQFRDEALLPLMLERLPLLVDKLCPKDVANVAHALAKLFVVCCCFACLALVAAALLPVVSSLTPMGLAKAATAFAWAETGERSSLLAAITAEAASRRDTFAVLEALNLVKALARIARAGHKTEAMGIRKCVSSMLGGPLLRGLGGVSTELQLQLLESLIALQHYEGVFIHRRLLPALLGRLPQPGAGTVAIRHKGDRLQLYARLLRCLCTFPAASPVALDLLQGLIEDLPSAIRVSSNLAAAAEAVVALHELNCKDLSCFYAAEAALLRSRRQTLQQLQPTHIRELRRAYEALQEGQEAWGELLHFLCRVEEALDKAGAGAPAQESNSYDEQPPRQQQQEGEQPHRHVVAHTYVSGSGHRAEAVLLRRGLKSPA